jgi:protein pelota
MKLISRHIEKNGSGYMKFDPEESEDLWHVYNLIAPGDVVRASTFRKIQSESTTGSVESQKVRLTLQLEVEDTEYDGVSHLVHVKGRNTSENRFVKLGQYHTVELAVNRPFSLMKAEWDAISFERVDLACNVAKRATIAAVVIQEGLANICLVTEYMTVVRQRIEVTIPKKSRGSSSNHEKAMQRFYDQIYQAVIRHIDFDLVKVILVASPGYIRVG